MNIDHWQASIRVQTNFKYVWTYTCISCAINQARTTKLNVCVRVYHSIHSRKLCGVYIVIRPFLHIHLTLIAVVTSKNCNSNYLFDYNWWPNDEQEIATSCYFIMIRFSLWWEATYLIKLELKFVMRADYLETFITFATNLLLPFCIQRASIRFFMHASSWNSLKSAGRCKIIALALCFSNFSCS